MMMEDIQVLKPTIFGSFPLFFNKIYKSTCENFSKQGKRVQDILTRDLKEKIKNLSISGELSKQPLCDPQVFQRVKEMMGG